MDQLGELSVSSISDEIQHARKAIDKQFGYTSCLLDELSMNHRRQWLTGEMAAASSSDQDTSDHANAQPDATVTQDAVDDDRESDQEPHNVICHRPERTPKEREIAIKDAGVWVRFPHSPEAGHADIVNYATDDWRNKKALMTLTIAKDQVDSLSLIFTDDNKIGDGIFVISGYFLPHEGGDRVPCKGTDFQRVQIPPGNWIAPAGSPWSG